LSLVQMDILGSPNLGVYCYANDHVCLVPRGLNERKMRRIEECLGVKTYQATVAGSILLGVFIAGNSYGILLPRIVEEDELKFIKEVCDVKVKVLHVKWTAIGNMMVVNDKGGLIDPSAPRGLVSEVSRTLEIPVERGRISGLTYVGSLSVATSKGALTHPKIRFEEKVKLERVLGVESEACTVNSGVQFPKSGVLANSKGAVVGSLTSGAEKAVIANVLQV